MWEKFWQWLVKSSADPNQVALSIKGALPFLISTILYLSPVLHLNLGAAQLTSVSDLIIQIVVIGCGIISGIATALGLIRKIYLTWFDKTPTA